MQIKDFKLERYFARYEFNVEYVLCASDCQSMTVEELLALEPDSQEQLNRLYMGYTESQGSPALRREIARIYQNIDFAQVLVHSGAEEAIFLFMHAVLRAGDHVIVHQPCYQSLHEVARDIGCRVTPWLAREENNWALNLKDLEKNIRPDTKAVILNTPHNPTGYLMEGDTFLELNRLLQEKDIILFSDEVYRESEYSAADRLPAACDINENAVSLGVMSKTYGLAGLRIGWIATHHQVIYDRMDALKAYTTICNSAPSEFFAELALRHRQKLIDRNVDIITRNLVLVDAFFRRYPEIFAWQLPKAGPIAFPRLIGLDVNAFCDALIQKAGVLLLPGTLFEDSLNHFRIGFGRLNVPEAIARVETFLKEMF
jgi:aspartate/methionine/tyrosine aminotransferase